MSFGDCNLCLWLSQPCPDSLPCTCRENPRSLHRKPQHMCFSALLLASHFCCSFQTPRIMISNHYHVSNALQKYSKQWLSYIYILQQSRRQTRKTWTKEIWLMNPHSVSVSHPDYFKNPHSQKHCFHHFTKTFFKRLRAYCNIWLQN